jgi:tetratricopeptide (TPR) repeat protein
MRLAATVWWFWERNGSTAEARMWLRRALDAADEEGAELAGVLQGMGHLLSTGSAEDREEADRLLGRALAIFRRLGDTRSVATVLIASSWAHGRAVQLDALRARLEEAIALLPPTGAEALLSRALYRLGEVAHASGDHESAMALVVRARDIRARQGDDIFVAQMQDVLAYLMLETGRVEEARKALDALVPTLFRLKQPTVKLQVLESYVLLLSRLGALREATTTRGAVEALREQLGLAMDAPDDQLVEAEVAGFRSQLGPDVWETAMEAGRRLSSDEALMSAHRAAAACRG